MTLATQMFHGITEAYQVLSDKQRRAEYDADLAFHKSTLSGAAAARDTVM